MLHASRSVQCNPHLLLILTAPCHCYVQCVLQYCLNSLPQERLISLPLMSIAYLFWFMYC